MVNHKYTWNSIYPSFVANILYKKVTNANNTDESLVFILQPDQKKEKRAEKIALLY